MPTNGSVFFMGRYLTLRQKNFCIFRIKRGQDQIPCYLVRLILAKETYVLFEFALQDCALTRKTSPTPSSTYFHSDASTTTSRSLLIPCIDATIFASHRAKQHRPKSGTSSLHISSMAFPG